MHFFVDNRFVKLYAYFSVVHIRLEISTTYQYRLRLNISSL